MTDRLESILDRLERLVAADTRNPPRAIAVDHPIVQAATADLAGFDVSVEDLGEGSLCILAVRGRPETLINVHLDTVPDAPGWTDDPFRLRREAESAIGLGACDVKGAAAAAIEAAVATDAEAAFLFTTDEEHGTGRCVRSYLKTPSPFARVVVCEPTKAEALLAHRGVVSFRLTFRGQAGHASQGGAKSAVHRAAQWIADACALDADLTKASDPLSGLRLNVGKIEGGEKANMVAAKCMLQVGCRPGPDWDVPNLAERLGKLAPADHLDRIETAFAGPALPPNPDMRAFARRADLPIADGAAFWTEAALFAQAGLPAMVYGPGDIAQAHAADEHVSHAHLLQAFEGYAAILERTP